MGKSSIHIQPVKGGSEQHNERTKELSYVRAELSHLNSGFKDVSIAEAKAFAKQNYQEKVGQKMQAKATPIREGVLLTSEAHTAEDLRRLGKEIEKEFGIKTIQAYCHKDEGHYDKETAEWKPNYHGHMVFDWTDHETGKSIKMSRDDMSKLQTIVADGLGLERGKNSSVKHLNSVQFKQVQVEKDLAKTYDLKKGIPEAMEVKKNLEDTSMLTRANLKFLQEQVEQQRQQIAQQKEELEKNQAQKRNQGMSL